MQLEWFAAAMPDKGFNLIGRKRHPLCNRLQGKIPVGNVRLDQTTDILILLLFLFERSNRPNELSLLRLHPINDAPAIPTTVPPAKQISQSSRVFERNGCGAQYTVPNKGALTLLEDWY